MLNRNVYIICLLFVLTSFNGFNVNPCLSDLEKCLSKMAELSVPKAGVVYYMDFTVSKVMAKSASEPSSSVNALYIISENQMHYETAQLSVYRDDKEIITIINPSHQIVLSSAGKIPYNQDAITSIGSNQKALLKKCTIAECSDVEVSGVKLKKVTLVPNEELKANNINTMVLIYNPFANMIVSIETNYKPGKGVLKEKIVIHNTSYYYKGDMPKNIKSKVFSGSGKLIDRYKKYSVIDQRNK